MWEIWSNQLLPKALKSCPKSNKLPNLVTLVGGPQFDTFKFSSFTTRIKQLIYLLIHSNWRSSVWKYNQSDCVSSHKLKRGIQTLLDEEWTVLPDGTKQPLNVFEAIRDIKKADGNEIDPLGLKQGLFLLKTLAKLQRST